MISYSNDLNDKLLEIAERVKVLSDENTSLGLKNEKLKLMLSQQNKDPKAQFSRKIKSRLPERTEGPKVLGKY